MRNHSIYSFKEVLKRRGVFVANSSVLLKFTTGEDVLSHLDPQFIESMLIHGVALPTSTGGIDP